MTSQPLAYVDHQPVSIRDMSDLVTKVETCLAGRRGFTLYTLNLDHLVKRRQDRRFNELYARATFVTADGWPVVSLAHRHSPTVKRTTGADLVGPVCQIAARLRTPIAFLGATQETLDKAADWLRSSYPSLEIVARVAPSWDFDPRGVEADAAIARIGESGARLCFVALGAPKQEVFSDRAFQVCPGVGFLCVGAALDFIAGASLRAPRFAQRHGLEWAWRLILQPRRLGLRYMRCGLLFMRLLLTWERGPVLTEPRVGP